MNPIHIAAMNGHVEILQELLELDYLERVHRGQTVLHLCVKHCQLRALEVLMGKLAGQLASVKDNDGDTILHWAVRSKLVEKALGASRAIEGGLAPRTPRPRLGGL